MKGPSHAVSLGVFVDEALSFIDSHAIPLDAVAVSCGPGSYTGLRIGVSMAKGICFGLGIPLISVPTLELLASTAIRNYPENDALYCAMLDARRMEVYAAIYNQRREQVREVKADIVTAETYAPYLNEGKVCFFGNGSGKCKSVIEHPNAVFIPDVHPIAAQMMSLAEERYANRQFEDVAYFEPFYLKEFQATIAKNKVLGEVLHPHK